MQPINLGGDGRVHVVARHNGRIAASLGTSGHIRLHALDPSGDRLAAVDGRRNVRALSLSLAGQPPAWAAIFDGQAAHVEAIAHGHGHGHAHAHDRLALADPRPSASFARLLRPDAVDAPTAGPRPRGPHDPPGLAWPGRQTGGSPPTA